MAKGLLTIPGKPIFVVDAHKDDGSASTAVIASNANLTPGLVRALHLTKLY